MLLNIIYILYFFDLLYLKHETEKIPKLPVGKMSLVNVSNVSLNFNLAYNIILNVLLL